MAKKIDYIVFTIIFYFATFLWSRYLIKDLTWSLIFSAIFTIVLFSFIYAMLSKIKKKPYPEERLVKEILIKGNEYPAILLSKVLEKKEIPHKLQKNLIFVNNNLVVLDFKFSEYSASDIVSCYHKYKEYQFDRLLIITKSTKRNFYQYSSFLPVKVEVCKIHNFFKFLNKNNALPDLENKKSKTNYKELLQVFFRRQNFKYFIFSGGILIFVAFFVPMKIYYLVFGSLSLLNAILCLTPLSTMETEKKVSLENIVKNGFAQDSKDNFEKNEMSTNEKSELIMSKQDNATKSKTNDSCVTKDKIQKSENGNAKNFNNNNTAKNNEKITLKNDSISTNKTDRKNCSNKDDLNQSKIKCNKDTKIVSSNSSKNNIDKVTSNKETAKHKNNKNKDK